MAKFPTIQEMAKEVADEALNNVLYKDKSIKEWIDLFAERDFVEVTRCKDCEYKNLSYTVKPENEKICFMSGLRRKDENCFCSYGGRKETT